MTELDTTANTETKDFSDELSDEALDRDEGGGRVTGYCVSVNPSL